MERAERKIQISLNYLVKRPDVCQGTGIREPSFRFLRSESLCVRECLCSLIGCYSPIFLGYFQFGCVFVFLRDLAIVVVYFFSLFSYLKIFCLFAFLLRYFSSDSNYFLLLCIFVEFLHIFCSLVAAFLPLFLPFVFPLSFCVTHTRSRMSLWMELEKERGSKGMVKDDVSVFDVVSR